LGWVEWGEKRRGFSWQVKNNNNFPELVMTGLQKHSREDLGLLLDRGVIGQPWKAGEGLGYSYRHQ
jgi:hypothetical protein